MAKNVLSYYRPSFMGGLMSLFSFGIDSHRFDAYLNGNNGDDIAEDWKTVGNDLRSAMSEFSREYM